MHNTSTLSAGAILQTRYASLKPRTQTPTQTSRHIPATTSIEVPVGNKPTNNTSIALPAAIRALITGSDYWIKAKTNRYRKLIREGHLQTLLRLAREAQTKVQPANWFASVCSKARWESQTLPYLAKLHEMARKADAVARRLETPINRISKFIYQQIWKGVNVERWAIVAQEVRHEKPGQSREKYFAWLCMHGQRLAL